MPQHKILTEIAIKAAKPPDSGRLTLWDGAVKHFGVRISERGAKSYIVLLGSGRRQMIGQVGSVTLAEARSKAQRILAERTMGRHRPSTATWKSALDQYLAYCQTRCRPSTFYEYDRSLKVYFPFGNTRLSEITKQDIARKLDKLHQQPSQQAHALVYIKIFFRWALQRGHIDHDPTAALKTHKSTARARVLSDEELRRIWNACDGTYGTIVKLLILTGQRRGEIAALHCEWVSEEARTISFPASITKNRRPHTIPFGEMTYSILDNFGSKKLVFLARARHTSFNGWSKSKMVLDQASGLTDWTLHDLRRTYRTIHARIGTPPHIAERLINHVSATSEVAKIYDRWTYGPEMTQAVLNFEAFLTKILEAQ